jgi:flagellar motility protein MotE (MotC chaperone)
MKMAFAAIIPLVVIVGLGYGLARIGILPVDKIAEKNPALGSAFKAVGLYRPPAHAAKAEAVPDPLAGEKKALQAQRDELSKERNELDSQADRKRQSDARAREAEEAAKPDPKNLARLASIYEQMAPAAVDKIFARLPNSEVIAILHRMDEKKVAEFLAGVTPERAARLTQELARPMETSPATP